MSYKVLYRKYRPSNFSEVVGQEATVKILKNSIINDKISHAYLFAGPRGTGKTSMARIFAKTINCLEPQNGEACGKCLNCQNFNSSPDIIEIDAASNNGVDEIRELINNIKLMPASSKYKVYIIDEVHMLSQSAFNALLLTLEEPPSHVIFILATTNIESVPITILSRCQKYEFFRINDDLITKQLKKVCEEEKIEYTMDGLKEITTLADGGMRDALSMLDQLSKETSKIDLDLVVKELGSISLVKINDLIKNIDDNNIDETIKIIEELKKTNLNYKIVIKKIIEILSKKAVEVLKNGETGILNYDKIKRIILELNDCLNKININVNPYIIVEMILLDSFKTCEKETSKPIVIKQVKKEEQPKKPVKEKEKENQPKKISENSTENEKKETISDDFKKIRLNNCFVDANKEELNKIKESWTEFIGKSSPTIKGLISDTMPVVASKTYVVLISNINHQDIEVNQEHIAIENEYEQINKQNIKIVALTNNEWLEEKEKYIANIKKGYKYQLQEEKQEEIPDELEEIAKDIFDLNKVEIK